jgi:hypothetical protein
MGNTQQEQAITDDEDLSQTLENLVVLTFFFFFSFFF